MVRVWWLSVLSAIPGVWASDAGGGIFRSDTRLVLVNVSVVDTYDRPVTGLEPRHFRVLDDGKEQPIQFFSREDTPISLALIFDLSGSMEGKLPGARAMVARLCASMGPDDEMFLVTVSRSPRIAMDYTSDCGQIQNALLFARARGWTPLLDAIPPALRHLKQARNGRKAVLIVSDGGENASRMRPANIRRLVSEAAAPVYAAALTEGAPPAPEVAEFAPWSGPDLLRDIAASSGGRYFEIDDPRHTEEAADRIAAEMREQYVIGYRAPRADREGLYRRISIKVLRDRDLPRMSVSYRNGYYAQ